MLRNLLQRGVAVAFPLLDRRHFLRTSRLVWSMMGFGVGLMSHCWMMEVCPWLAGMCRCCIGG